MLTDAFIAAPDSGAAEKPEFYNQLRTSIDEGELDIPTVNASQDPEFLFVDQKVFERCIYLCFFVFCLNHVNG